MPYRWVWAMHNLSSDEQVAQLLAVMTRAKGAGYNGVALSDYKFSILDRMPPHYFENVARVKAAARTLGLDLYPTVCNMGYSNGLLAHNPDLAEGLPIRDARFVVQGKEARLDPEPGTGLKNGDFAQAAGDKMAAWDFQDGIGVASFADRAVIYDGHPSLRWQDIGTSDPGAGHGRIMQRVAVSPFRQYHLSVWVKTQDFEVPGAFQALVLAPDGKGLTFGGDWHIEKTQEWTQYHLVFNSRANTTASVYLGTWGGKGGKLWLADARLEEAGLLNVLRRPGCPLTVRGEDGTRYAEGRDFQAVKDDRLGMVPWPGGYEVWHAPPALRLTAGSRLKDGQRLRVSFSAPVIRRVSPAAHVFVWSDMFDPAHNAHGDYYLVNGTWAGSWAGLARDVVVINWNSDKPKQSLPWFAGRGHAQILAGYYDGSPQSIRPWLAAGAGVPGLTGVMYTTWGQHYDDLEAFADAAWGQAKK